MKSTQPARGEAGDISAGMVTSPHNHSTSPFYHAGPRVCMSCGNAQKNTQHGWGAQEEARRERQSTKSDWLASGQGLRCSTNFRGSDLPREIRIILNTRGCAQTLQTLLLQELTLFYITAGPDCMHNYEVTSTYRAHARTLNCYRPRLQQV